ncbi:MAG: peptidoglycan-binding domain-containing protein [Candidatus Acidiferrales bacterium]
MVHVFNLLTTDFQLWNVDARIGMGSTGDDVRLIQYVLARAPEAAQYWPDKISGSSGIAVSDVDGIWGPQTDAAQKWLEQNWKGNNPVVADGFIDPLQGGITFGTDTTYEYKLSVALFLYAIAANQGTVWVSKGSTETIMDMPNDGQCPADLGYALQAALGHP